MLLPGSVPFKYAIFVCAVLHIEGSKTTKSATWPDYCLLSGFLLIIYLFYATAGACKLDSNTFWTPLPAHHIYKPLLDSLSNPHLATI